MAEPITLVALLLVTSLLLFCGFSVFLHATLFNVQRFGLLVIPNEQVGSNQHTLQVGIGFLHDLKSELLSLIVLTEAI